MHIADHSRRSYYLAYVRREQQRYEEALALYEEALEITEACVGRQSVDYADTLYSMAYVHLYLRHFDKALELCTEAVEIHEACVGPESVDTQRSKQLLQDIQQARTVHER